MSLDIGKNFQKLKHFAGQGFKRGDTSETLSSELQNAEKRLELLKTVISNLIKKISASLHASGISDTERRMKRMTNGQLESVLQESSRTAGEGTLCDVLTMASKAMCSMNMEQQRLELHIENNILAFFKQSEEDIKGIKKTKQFLTKLIFDMDTTRSRVQAASKQNDEHPSSTAQTKVTSLTLEYDEALSKVTISKDQYTTEVLTFLAKEKEICDKIVEWTTLHSTYLEQASESLKIIVPEMHKTIDASTTRPVFGCPLEDHLGSTGREIALVIETCVSILYHHGLDEQGLFRIAASTSKLKKFKAGFDMGKLVDEDEFFTDFHTVSSILKLYIRELPEPLLTFHLFDEFMSAIGAYAKDREEGLKQLRVVVNKLPQVNYDNAKYLIKFLAKLAGKSEVNLMTPSNIAIVFGPNLLYPQTSADTPMNFTLSGHQNAVVEALVANEAELFPGGFHVVDLEHSSPEDGVELGSFRSPNVKPPTPSTKKPSNEVEYKLKPEIPPKSPTAKNVDTSVTGSPVSPNAGRKVKKAPKPPPAPSREAVNRADITRRKSETNMEPRPPARPSQPPPSTPAPSTPAPPVPKKEAADGLDPDISNTRGTQNTTAYASVDVISAGKVDKLPPTDSRSNPSPGKPKVPPPLPKRFDSAAGDSNSHHGLKKAHTLGVNSVESSADLDRRVRASSKSEVTPM